MCMSIFTATAGQVYALGDAKAIFKVTDSGFADDEITFTVKFASTQTKMTGAIIKAQFDSEALEVVVDKTHAAGSYDAYGDFTENVAGMYEAGLEFNNPDVFSVGYMSSSNSGFTVTGDTAFFTITFRAISEDRLTTDVTFTCTEFSTDDGNDDNDIKKTDGAQEIDSVSFHPLSMPKVTQVNSYNQGLRVIWSESVGATSYDLYRKEADATAWELISSDIGTATEFVDENAGMGKEYYYTVSASNADGSTPYDETGLAGMNFGSISEINAEAVATGAKITWSALDGAESYEVWRKLSVSNSWQKVETVASTEKAEEEYIDESISSGVFYDYKVRAISGKYSADMSCEPATVRFIAVPETTVSNAFYGIEISFDEVDGAEKYIIEKKAAGESDFTVLAEITAGEETSYSDENVTAGTQYVYSIQAVASDISSARTEFDPITRLGTTAVKEISNKEDGVYISWDEVSGVSKYTVFRKTAEDTLYATYDGITGTSYTDTDVTSGTEYTYFVCAEDETGYGGYEEEVVFTYLDAPTITSVSNINEGIRVMWKSVPGATGYKIYRVEAGENNWAEIATSSSLSYTDTIDEAQHGVYYRYTVSAVNDKGIESAYNATGFEGMYFGTVSSISATIVKNGAVISWGALEKANAYEVYRKTEDSDWVFQKKVTTNTYADTAMSSGITYYYMVKALSGNNVAEMTVAPAQAKYLAMPTSVVKNVVDGIKITITPVGGAEGYVIEKKVNGEWKELKTLGANETTYIDKDVVGDETYSYKVYATSADINSYAYETAEIMRLGSPKITSISNVIPGVKLQWTPIDDGKAYEVYRKSSTDTVWEYLATVSGTTYTDGLVDNGETYYYTINALTVDGGFSGYDDIGKKITFVETPDMRSVSNTTKGITFKWYAVDGATKYRVYRKAAGEKSWTTLGEVSGTSYTDSKNLVSGTSYRYTVRAINGNLGGLDSTGLVIKYVATPKLKSIANTASGIQVKWNAVKNAKSYKVYRKGPGQTSWKYVGEVKTTSYTDKSVKNANGKVYKYTVRAVCGSTLGAYNTSGISLKRLSNPALKSAVSSKSGITVKWGAVTGSTGYIVYRKTSGGSFKQIATVKGAKKVSYIDKSAKKGKTYTYTVRAYSGSAKSAYNKGISCKDRY